MKAKKPIRPIWTTTVDPSEYDYVGQFEHAVKLSNKSEETYLPTDIGKIWGLVVSHQRLERENAALRAENGKLRLLLIRANKWVRMVDNRRDEVRHWLRHDADPRPLREDINATLARKEQP